ncbi:AlpA family transcriptional regulator [Zoogloea sp. 1C4]|uniref:helix-turn-helix transcriptional regulator n=1 Tax=Zoogloea sp. 1C4 TaxID=2570190 RepID=UPI001292AA84|nr:AlpA family phage regulatory protein [Zoogloea sp. 1C4]
MQQIVHTPALLSRRSVEAITSISRASIYRLMKAGEFPTPVRVSANRVAWREADIRLWIEARQPN